jgi:imidazolonepropionase
LGLRLHANQLGHGDGVVLGVELGCASVDHCTYLDDHDIEALSGSSTVATFLPATDFSTRQPYPDARRVLDAGATVALATNCNPGSSYTTSMPFCVALAVRELGMMPDEAILAATAGGAAALRRDDIGQLAPGSRGDLIILDAKAPIDFVYRPGVPIVALTMIGGTVVHGVG